MAIPVSGPKFEACPQGVHHAVCCDVVDLGIVSTPFGDKSQVQIRWQVDLANSKGDRYVVRKNYTRTLAPKANLRKDLEMWRGRPMTEKETEMFDLERLLGINCQIQVMHKLADNGSVYANVVAVLPIAKNVAKIAVENYQRQKDREQAQDDPRPGSVREADPWSAPDSPQTKGESWEEPEPTDAAADDIPF